MPVKTAHDIIVWNGDDVHTYRKTLDWSEITMAFARRGYQVEILRDQEQIDNLKNGKRGESLIRYLKRHHHRNDGIAILELPREYESD